MTSSHTRKGTEGHPEALEGLEQLCFLEQARQVLCDEADGRARASGGHINPDDTEKIETILADLGIG